MTKPKVTIVLKSRTSPIQWELSIPLKDFKPKDVAEIIKYLEDAITEILKEVHRV